MSKTNLHCINQFYSIIKRETRNNEIDIKLEIIVTNFKDKTHAEIITETQSSTKNLELQPVISEGFIGRGTITPSFFHKTLTESNIVIYLERNDEVHPLIKKLGVLTANVINENMIELELVSSSIFYTGCGKNLVNTFLECCRESGFEIVILNSLIAPLGFYLKLGMTYLGYTTHNGNKKHYMAFDLDKNTINHYPSSKIRFNPPRPGNSYKVPTEEEALGFMGDNKALQLNNTRIKNSKYIKDVLAHRKTNKTGLKYVSVNKALEKHVLKLQQLYRQRKTQRHKKSRKN